ncbi:flagellar filament capping protein FliD [Marinobacterium sp. YM272]|uniref:flagellar filament capping protein FliD n=1 Tax=Marinobacterium sp. YM272 TaxID=3421654 RepID=UPI003D7FFEE3
MAITLSGVGSGLDIQSLVSQLVQSEGQAKNNALNRRESNYQTELSALGRLKSSLSSFQSAAAKLSDVNDLLQLSANSGDDSLFSATASGSATSGEYSIEVRNLAKAQKLNSVGFSSSDATVGTGTIKISSGDNTFDVEIKAGEQSLSGIRDSINSAADNSSVSASIVNVDDGLGGTEARLVLTAKNSGTANEISISVADDDGDSTDTSGLSQLAYDVADGTINLSELVAADDAVIRVDGLDVTRSSNSIDDVIDGVTIDLKVAEVDRTVGLFVSVDTSATQKTVQAFVDSYNNLVNTFTSLTGYDADKESGGALQGDFTARQIMNDVRSILRETSDSGEFSSLFSMGIEIDQYGKMSLDSTKFKDVLASRPDALTNLLSSEDGIAGKLEARLKEALDLGGVFDSRTKSLNQSIDKIDDERLDLEDHLSTMETRMLNQFIAMDSLVAQYNNTGSYLTSQLAALPGFTSQSK